MENERNILKLNENKKYIIQCLKGNEVYYYKDIDAHTTLDTVKEDIININNQFKNLANLEINITTEYENGESQTETTTITDIIKRIDDLHKNEKERIQDLIVSFNKKKEEYEIIPSSSENVHLVDFNCKEIRILCNAEKIDNITNNFIELRAYAPEISDKVSYILEGKDGDIKSEEITKLLEDNLYKRKYISIMLKVADESGNYLGLESSNTDFAGWYFTISWSNNGKTIKTDKLRINLASNEDNFNFIDKSLEYPLSQKVEEIENNLPPLEKGLTNKNSIQITGADEDFGNEIYNGVSGPYSQGAVSLALNSTVTGTGAFATGRRNKSLNKQTVTMGQANIATAEYSAAFNAGNETFGRYATVLNCQNYGFGSYSLIGGYQNISGGIASLIHGHGNVEAYIACSLSVGEVFLTTASIIYGKNTFYNMNSENSVLIGECTSSGGKINYLDKQLEFTFKTDSFGNDIVDFVSGTIPYKKLINSDGIIEFIVFSIDDLTVNFIPKYNSISGKDNKLLTGTYNILSGKSNIISSERSLVIGYANKLRRGNSTFLTGSSNTIESSTVSFINGNNMNISNKLDYSIIAGENLTGESILYSSINTSNINFGKIEFSNILGTGFNINETDLKYSLILGKGHTIENNEFSLVTGEINKILPTTTVPTPQYNVVFGGNNTVKGSNRTLVSGKNNIVVNSQNDLVIGYGNKIYQSGDGLDTSSSIFLGDNNISDESNPINGKNIVIGHSNNLKKNIQNNYLLGNGLVTNDNLSNTVILGSYNTIPEKSSNGEYLDCFIIGGGTSVSLRNNILSLPSLYGKNTGRAAILNSDFLIQGNTTIKENLTIGSAQIKSEPSINSMIMCNIYDIFPTEVTNITYNNYKTGYFYRIRDLETKCTGTSVDSEFFDELY